MNARKEIRRGFTLIELLVVVAIIAILLALMMPALSNVRERARTMKCWDGMRKIGQWSFAFAEDNNDRLPGGGSASNGSRSWHDVLNLRYANPKIQRLGQTPQKNRIYCPEMKPWSAGSPRYPRAYWYNRDMNGGYPADKYGEIVTEPYRMPAGWLSYTLGARTSRVPRSQMYMVIENERSSDVLAWAGVGPVPVGTDPTAPPWSGPDGIYAFRHRTPDGRMAGNFLFFDLHVELLNPDSPDVRAASRVFF